MNTNKEDVPIYVGLELWVSWEKVPAKCRGKQNFGDKLNTWHAQYARKLGTKIWGPYGVAWGLRDLRFGTEGRDGDKPARVTLDAIFFWPGNPVGFEVSHCWPWEPNQHGRAKVQTACLKKAMSYLGAADECYWDVDEDAAQPTITTAEAKAEALSNCKRAKTTDYLDELLNWARTVGFTMNDMANIKTAVDAKRTELEATEVFGGEEKEGKA